MAREGADFPARDPGGNLGLPFTPGDHGIGHGQEGLAGLGDEVPGEVGLDPSDGLEGELQVGGDEGFGLFDQFGPLVLGVGQELFLFEGEGHLGALRPVAGVNLDGDLGFAAGMEIPSDRDVWDRMSRDKCRK